MKLWGGRFEEGPSEVFERFSGSLAFRPAPDRRRYPRLPGLRARARRRRHSDRGRAHSACRGLRNDPRAGCAAGFFYDGAADEDVHTLVIRKLKERVGALADKIHTGRSRNDQVSLDVRLWLRDEIDAVVQRLLLRLLESLVAWPAAIPTPSIPGYTHLAPRAAGPVAALSAGVFRNVRARSTSASAGSRAAST